MCPEEFIWRIMQLFNNKKYHTIVDRLKSILIDTIKNVWWLVTFRKKKKSNNNSIKRWIKMRTMDVMTKYANEFLYS